MPTVSSTLSLSDDTLPTRFSCPAPADHGVRLAPHVRQPLLQVCADLSTPETTERELRVLASAAREHPRAARRMLVLTRDQVPSTPPSDVLVPPVYEWMLADPPES